MKTTPKKNGKKKHSPQDLQEIIVEATKLALEIEKMTAALEVLKSTIRDHALALMGPEQNNLAIDTELGKCHVVKVKDQLVVVEGFDADVLKKTLSKELWNTFFTLTPQLRGTAGDAFLRLSEEHRIALGDPVPFQFAPRRAQVRLPK